MLGYPRTPPPSGTPAADWPPPLPPPDPKIFRTWLGVKIRTSRPPRMHACMLTTLSHAFYSKGSGHLQIKSFCLFCIFEVPLYRYLGILLYLS